MCEIISEVSSPTETFATTEALLKVENDDCEDVTAVCVSMISKPPPSPNLLQQLHYVRHKVYGDGNCSYHAMDDIPYSRIRVIYVLRPCAIGFTLRNVRDIF